MKTEWSFLLLLLVYFIPHALLLTYMPMKLDECLYAIMIEEQIEKPTIIPTFLGYEVGWKPPVYFWAAGVLVVILKQMSFLPLDAVYKLPNVFFGFVNLILFYALIKKTTKNEKIAFLCGVAFALTPLVMFLDNSVLTDTLSLTFILAAVLTYLKGEETPVFFLLAGMFGFLGFFTKQVNALVAPIVIAFHFFQNDRKMLLHPFFIISVLLIPAAFLLNYALYADVAQAQSVFYDLIGSKLGQITNPLFLVGSLYFFMALAAVWFFLSVLGFARWWRESAMFTAWYALILFPLVAGNLMPWYFLPVMPAVVYFAVKAMAYDEKRKLRIDRFFRIMFVIMAAFNLLIGMLVFYAVENQYSAEKRAGEWLAGRENVLIIGKYSPTVFAYKMLEEKRGAGAWLDYGMVFSGGLVGEVPFGKIAPFLKDYYGPQENITDGNFGKMFFEPGIYRKDTNIMDFDYVVFAGVENPQMDGDLVFNESSIEIYHLNR